MHFPTLRGFLTSIFLLSCLFACSVLAAVAQTVHVDVSAAKAIAFDPDKAMGTSMDILSAKEFETVYSERIIKAGLSAGWGPMSYRQNTELTYTAWHGNPNGTWSDEKHKSGYFLGDAEPQNFLRESFGYRLPHRGADSVGAFLTHAGPDAVYYHSPIQPEPLRSGCHAWSTYGNFAANEKLEIRQYTAQYFASQLLNLDWVKHGGGTHRLYPALGDLQDDAKHDLITAYAVKRPDDQWSMLIINKDPSNAHDVKIAFDDAGKGTASFSGRVNMVTFGAAEYVWRPSGQAVTRIRWPSKAKQPAMDGRPQGPSAKGIGHGADRKSWWPIETTESPSRLAA